MDDCGLIIKITSIDCSNRSINEYMHVSQLFIIKLLSLRQNFLKLKLKSKVWIWLIIMVPTSKLQNYLWLPNFNFHVLGLSDKETT